VRAARARACAWLPVGGRSSVEKEREGFVKGTRAVRYDAILQLFIA